MRILWSSQYTPKSAGQAVRFEEVWVRRWDQIRENPNERQCVKFDRISDILKRFFMDKTDEVDIATNERKWTISFEEITSIWPNVRELHFMNEYRFDDKVLHRLIDQIERKDKNTLQKVVFLYFNYVECDIMESDKIMNPEELDQKLKNKLLTLGWTMEMRAVTPITGGPAAGYKITVKRSVLRGRRQLSNLNPMGKLRKITSNSISRRVSDLL